MGRRADRHGASSLVGAGEAEIWSDPSGHRTQVRWIRQIGCVFHAAVEDVHAPGTGDPVFVQACHGEGDVEEPSRLVRTDAVNPSMGDATDAPDTLPLIVADPSPYCF